MHHQVHKFQQRLSIKLTGAVPLLKPLLLDSTASVQNSAALALGRLAGHNEDMAKEVTSHGIVPELVHALSNPNRFYKKSAALVLRAVSKHSAELSEVVVNGGALDALVSCLEEFDPSVKEAAAWAIGYIARHTTQLAQAVADSGAVPLLVLCYQEPELALKRISASALSDVAKHSPELAQVVVDAGSVPLVAKDLCHIDTMLKRQVCGCLAQVAKHTVDLAEMVVEAEIFPSILHSLKDADEMVRKNAMTCVREISRFTPDLAKLVVNAGGVAVTVEYITTAGGSNKLPGIMTLGYIGAFSETLALAIIVSKGIEPLKDTLINESEGYLKAAAAWSLGQIGKHSADHARALAEADVLRRLLDLYLDKTSSEDVKVKAKKSLKAILQKCTHLVALEALLKSAPPNILKYAVEQFAKVLPNDVKAKRAFVQSGSLQRLQEIKAEPGTKIRDLIEEVNAIYPPELVNYYSPNYTEALMKRLDDHLAATG